MVALAAPTWGYNIHQHSPDHLVQDTQKLTLEGSQPSGAALLSDSVAFAGFPGFPAAGAVEPAFFAVADLAPAFPAPAPVAGVVELPAALAVALGAFPVPAAAMEERGVSPVSDCFMGVYQ